MAVIRGRQALSLATDVQLVPKGAVRFRLDWQTAGGGAALDLQPATAEPA